MSSMKILVIDLLEILILKYICLYEGKNFFRDLYDNMGMLS